MEPLRNRTAADPIPVLHDRARAKINLFLHVLGRREDGYHLLESLVGFADFGDELALEPGARLSLTIDGPMAGGLLAEDDNLILKAARLFAETFPETRTGRFHLVKNLPVASGIGGGSSDAAATLRLLSAANHMDATDPRVMALARQLGADVPVCVEAKPRLMRGIGHELGPVLDYEEKPALLVNPRIEVETRAVFAALGLVPGERMVREAEAAPQVLLDQTRNDLEKPALIVAPKIRRVLDALTRSEGHRLVRMSGSGATCFAIYDEEDAMLRAASALRREFESWWLQPCRIQIPF